MTGLIIILFLLLLPASGLVLWMRTQPATPTQRLAGLSPLPEWRTTTTTTRPAVAPPRQLSRRSHRVSLARQRRRYQARIRQLERQQLALLYLMWQAQQRPARAVAQPGREVAHVA